MCEVVPFRVHSRTLFMCEYKSAVRFSAFHHILPSEAGELHQPVVSYLVGVSQRRLILSLSIFPSLPFALLAFIL